MGAKLKESDRQLLASVAEHRILTVRQLTILLGRNNRGLRRRLEGLATEGLVHVMVRGLVGRRGRPENLVGIAEQGVQLLSEDGIIPPTVRSEDVLVNRLPHLEHQLLVNWLRIHLTHAERVIFRLAVCFLAPTSPFIERDSDDRPLIFDRVAVSRTAESTTAFTPDGVILLTDKESRKNLLFFLEVDMGTEALSSRTRAATAVQQKISNYQTYFRSGQYKRYEKLWRCELNGFRLLFLANTFARLNALCRLVRDLPQTGFVWLTDQSRMFAGGVTADIWVRGGRLGAPFESILGTKLSCQTPIPARND